MSQVTTFSDYQQLAGRTAAMDVSKAIRQATFALGLTCEAGEVAELYMIDTGRQFATLPKELGDVLWYAAALCTENGLKMTDVTGLEDIASWQEHCYEKPMLDTRLVVEAAKVGDYMKKVIGHGHELDEQRLVSGLMKVMGAVGDLATAHGLRVADIATANIDKLRKRYPDGFTTERSINRDDDLEFSDGPPPIRE
jgi:NTP pyrophosphatase (non-canonical NTP hydrolase)